MTKAFKNLIKAASVPFLISIINKIIFINSEKRYSSKIKYKEFNFHHGKVKYMTYGNGEPILLLHGIGIGGSHYEFENNIIALSQYYKVYALDLLGFGESEKPSISYSAYLYVEMINSFIKEIIKSPVNIVASSNSAAFALMGYSFDSRLYKKMVLISPTGVSELKITKRHQIIKTMIELPIFGTLMYNMLASKCSIKKFLKENMYSKNLSPSNFYYNAHHGGVSNKYPISAFMGKYLDININHILNTIDIPVKIIWGRKNKVNSYFNLEKIKDNKNTNITYSLFVDSGLFPHVDNPNKFNEICRKFLKN